MLLPVRGEAHTCEQQAGLDALERRGPWAVGRGLWAVGCGPWAVGCGLWAVGCGRARRLLVRAGFEPSVAYSLTV
eukprot:scaffold35534_cov58-Phaeocystis_antarctica.AAC.1